MSLYENTIKIYTQYDYELCDISNEANIKLLKLRLDFKEKINPEPVVIKFYVKSENVFAQWSPTAEYIRNIRFDWSKAECKSSAAFGAPVQCLYGADGINSMTCAIADFKTPVSIKCGVCEENAAIEMDIEFFTCMTAKRSSYETIIRLDMRNIRIYDIMRDVSGWWRKSGNLPDMSVPDIAKHPMYSTWYSYHQNIDTEAVVAECKKAYKLGMRAVIVDDGWQTDNSERGYAYCGDWKPAIKRIGDMKAFVDAVHSTGMKFILWYSVPFVGKYSEAWNKFKGKFLDSADNDYCVLDPRYREVRDYLTGIYENAVREWGIDGFKLDFIDSLRMMESSNEYNSEMDTEQLEDAIEKLLGDILKRLRAIKPDILIEFRQNYIGPLMQTYGNMLRASDCPYDALTNRMRTLDLRMMSGCGVVHSDMLMWDMSGSAENAARQITNVLFSVPQISVKLNDIPAEHMEMLKFYLSFCDRYCDVLLEGSLHVYQPEMLYSMAYAQKGNRAVAVDFSGVVWNIESGIDEAVYVNAAQKDALYINAENIDGTYDILNCRGKIIEKGTLLRNTLKKFNVPVSGMIIIRR